jgi:hypothetical protein
MKVFAKVYVDIYSHPKFVAAGFEASGYWLHALTYLRHHESSDGFLADRFITTPLSAGRVQSRRLCEKLVSVGLFQRVEGGYFLCRYAEKNETKADIEAAKAFGRDRKARSRERYERPPPTADDDPPEGAVVAAEVTCDSLVPVTRDPSVLASCDDAGLSHASERCPGLLFVACCLSFGVCGLSFEAGGLSCTGDDAASDRGERQGQAQGQARIRPLPPSERNVSGGYWLEAFTAGITAATGRPCTMGRVYLGTLERLVETHAPARDSASACAWIRKEAHAFAKLWENASPAKGLTPDGLERWLNEGRRDPPTFGKSKIVQPAAKDWKLDDFSDLGATVHTAEGTLHPDGRFEPHGSH